MKEKIKIFGASLDASDLPLNLKMKLSYLNQLLNNEPPIPNYLDPYDGVLELSKIVSDNKFVKLGKLPIPSWLTPKPTIEDLSLINQAEYQKITKKGIIKKYAENIRDFVIEKIIPDIPLMIGVDHSLTGGVLKALSNHYGYENILVIILDAHFDGIPTNIALEITSFFKDHPNEINPLLFGTNSFTQDFSDLENTYNCASFLHYLIEDKIIAPENLVVFGCQDYPQEDFRSKRDERVQNFIKFFDSMEEKGVNIVPKSEIKKMIDMLKLILENIDRPYIYLSFDIDIGGFKDIYAMRFKDAIGINMEEIIQTVRILKEYMDKNNTKLVGFDIMEIDTYLLNRYFPKTGKKDLTIDIVDQYINILTQEN
ncbi:MAG: arginase family protein [Promethearchaeota archaeon]